MDETPSTIEEPITINEPATIEEGFDALERLLEQMDEEEGSLEHTFALYEQGMKLLKETGEKIEQVEKKVRILQQDGSFSDFEGA